MDGCVRFVARLLDGWMAIAWLRFVSANRGLTRISQSDMRLETWSVSVCLSGLLAQGAALVSAIKKRSHPGSTSLLIPFSVNPD